MRISDWSSDVCSSDLVWNGGKRRNPPAPKNEVRRKAGGLQESKMALVPPSSGRGSFIADSSDCFATHPGRRRNIFILSHCTCHHGLSPLKYRRCVSSLGGSACRSTVDRYFRPTIIRRPKDRQSVLER